MLSSYTSSEEDNFPVFEYLLKILGTTTKVLSCSKIPLTSMCVLRTSSSFSRPRLVSYPFEEALLQSVRTSFIADFIKYNEGLENKLTRAPLLGLAKSIYYLRRFGV